jgi:hypothetical protein
MRLTGRADGWRERHRRKMRALHRRIEHIRQFTGVLRGMEAAPARNQATMGTHRPFAPILKHAHLTCHPQTPDSRTRLVGVRLSANAEGTIALAFHLEGELSRLRIPESRPPHPVDGLWRHTCFEVFVMAGDGPGYREFNFSPSGEWAAYAFRDYRDGGLPEVALDPAIAVRRSGDRLELDAAIRRESLPPGRLLQLGLSAVVEDTDGRLSYWALKHPPGTPDFHHTEAFALELELP